MYDYYNNYYPDYLMHYGVKGMKWGHRKNAISVKAAGHRAMAKVYDINARTYKNSNKALSSMNAAARTQQLKKADQAQAAANAKRDQRNTPEAKAARRKTALKVGAAVAGTALAAYGAYKVGQAVKNKNFQIAQERGSKAFDDYIKNNYDSSLGLSVFKDGSATVSVGRDNGSFSKFGFKNESAASDYYNKLKLRNLDVEKEAEKIYSDHLKRASNDSLKNATKNVYNYYKDRRRR